MRRLSLAFAFAALPAVSAFAEAPTLNVQATCRATPAVNLDQQATYDNCMRSENAARDRLNKTWAKMRADWRSSCLKTTTLGGVPSYVELLTCVEMREAAANGQSGTPSGSMTGGRSVGVGSGSPPGTMGFPGGATSTPGNPGSNLDNGLGAGSAGSTAISSGRSIGSGSPTVGARSPAGSGSPGTVGSAGAGVSGTAGSAGSAGAGRSGGGGH